MANVDFVTIDLSKKQVDMEHPYKNEKNGLQINYSERKPDVPDDAPAEEKYTQYSKTVRIEDLKEMYEEERKAYLEQKRDTFVNMEIPTEWAKPFEGKDGVKYVSISVPIKENDERNYYNFVIPADSFRESTREKDMSYFGFPRKKKDTDEDYTVTLKRSVRQDDGYVDVTKEISSTELAEYMEAAKRNYSFINVEISNKLIRKFEGKDGTPYVAVSVPVYDEAKEKDVFYQIVVAPERIRDTENENTVRLSMFRKGGDGEDYVFHAEASVLNAETQQYDKVTKDMTSVEVANCFKESRERFKEQNASQGRSLGDELRENAAEGQGGQEVPGFRPVRRGGR